MTTRTAAREVVYLGWTGHGNYGDELLLETWRLALGIDAVSPVTRRERLADVRSAIHSYRTGRRTERMLLVGGGTVLGFQNWARHVADAARVYRADTVVALGAGAAESTDTFALGLQGHDWRRWSELRSILLGVRGPLTAVECERALGRPAVVGDPALLYPVVAGIERVHDADGPVGVSVGADPVSRFDPRSVAAAVRGMSGADTEIVLFALSPNDLAACRALQSELHRPSRIHRFDGDVRATTSQISRCSLMLTERLHGAVAAVGLGVPTVPLAYASKCDDFWLSVTGERPAVVPGSTEQQILDAATRALDPLERSATQAQVNVLRQRLVVGVRRIADWREGVTTIDQLREPLPFETVEPAGAHGGVA
ncbi:hypothetical protein DEJ30_01510 [Curtobacterium sp. MCPF17_003]|uniref:polysaccharide pyruvyl transferase family protein n=1 Tax=unclassified Curtobacterium TaxID=257496 RepID=UPI000D84132A|nr:MULTISPECIES: polysaccharide pyruvyl transferase family protein [unclassified Curtobacterium]PYY65766.1 hypothetical protein DEJ30_01510 [Curtobacterium sp. MCPF17_003]PZE73148.1 hypothetical protein DEJ27_01460 [Curtobacterium sp. MCPF17_018]